MSSSKTEFWQWKITVSKIVGCYDDLLGLLMKNETSVYKCMTNRVFVNSTY